MTAASGRRWARLVSRLDRLRVAAAWRFRRAQAALWVEPLFRSRCATVGGQLEIERNPRISGAGQIVVGDHVCLSGAIGITFSNVVRTDPKLTIGDHTFVAHGCQFFVAESVRIGRHCLLAGQVEVRDFDGHPVEAAERLANRPTPREGIKPVEIGDGVWIGSGALILRGVKIGDRAVVAARALVTGDVPPDILVAGNPARPVKALNNAHAARGRAEPPASTFGQRASIDRRVKHIVGELAGILAEDIDDRRWVTHYGVDSLQLLVLREMIEREFRVNLPDRTWLGLSSLGQMIDVLAELGVLDGDHAVFPSRIGSASCAVDSTPLPRGGRGVRSDLVYADLEVGMSRTGHNNLAEGPLLQYLGDLRWAHMSELSGQPSSRIVDAEGHPLYATFFYVEAMFPPGRPMAAIALDDRVTVVGDLGRFGTSMLDGTFYLVSSDGPSPPPPWPSLGSAREADVPTVRLANIFVRQFDGAQWLKRERPAGPGFARIPELPSAPDCHASVRAAAKDGCFARPPRHYVSMAPSPRRVLHRLVPDRDVNGVGLVYFAHYPVFLDIAEREALGAAALPLTDDLIDRRTLVRRRSAYLNNASARDTLVIDVESWIECPLGIGGLVPLDTPIRLWLNFRMYRRSDERLMMVSTAEKIIPGHALEALPFFSSLKAAAP